jgi:hypothetical protein
MEASLIKTVILVGAIAAMLWLKKHRGQTTETAAYT